MIRSLAKMRRLSKRFWRAREGATAVEFAIVALPFITLVFGILELGLVFLVQTTLDNATDDAARMIRTGQVQSSGGNAASFKSAVCSQMTWLNSSCAANLNVDVQTFSSLSDTQNPNSLVKNGAFDSGATKFDAGGGGDVVLVRTFYQWTLFTPLLNAGLVNLSGNKRLITSVAAFRNEPFPS